MPNWNEILEEVRKNGSSHDVVRRQYLDRLADVTKRNVIAYYSGWLQKGQLQSRGVGGFALDDADKNGFMAVINQLDRSKGLDLILHTPGGSIAATESLVDYLRSMFGTDVRAIVPQIAMSAGTMIALSCKEIVMGKHSSLGPIDPQINGIAAHGVIEEFMRAKEEVQTNPHIAPLWQVILSKYTPTLIGEAEKAIQWGEEIVPEWLKTGMFRDDRNADDKAKRIMEELGDHALTKSHARHISTSQARDLGLVVSALEDDDDLQDAVLSVHHACVQTLSVTPAIKIIENQLGVAHISSLSANLVAAVG